VNLYPFLLDLLKTIDASILGFILRQIEKQLWKGSAMLNIFVTHSTWAYSLLVIMANEIHLNGFFATCLEMAGELL
jgi:hypothetical protein